jgi:hypothetical protein
MDDLIWLDDMENRPEMNRNPQEDDDNVPANETDGIAAGHDESSAAEAGPQPALSTGSDQVPDDPDEAIAWLERLAAKQGALPEELPTIDDAAFAEESDLGPDDVDAGEMPEDPDEAMAWLEMLAAKEGAVADVDLESGQQLTDVPDPKATVGQEISSGSEPTAETLSADLDEALEGSLRSVLEEDLDWLEEMAVEPGPVEELATPSELLKVTEEPPTPEVAHDVAEAMAGAELLFAEPERDEIPGGEEEITAEPQFDEADEAMAWLEQLAARQGAPIEELTTIDATDEELKGSDTVFEAAPPADVMAIEAPSDEIEPVPAEAPSDQAPEPEMEQAVVETAAEDPVEQAVDDNLGAELDVPEPLAESLETEPQGEVDLAPKPPSSDEDLAWLDTLGDVDAEKWIEAEAADYKEPIDEVAEPVAHHESAAVDDSLLETAGDISVEIPAGPGADALLEARQAMKAGELTESLSKYAVLVEEGQLLAFLIDDLEAVAEKRGGEPGLQRVLGDAYARNGQLRKALESYREALANL